jgi:hypothetical protein
LKKIKLFRISRYGKSIKIGVAIEKSGGRSWRGGRGCGGGRRGQAKTIFVVEIIEAYRRGGGRV